MFGRGRVGIMGEIAKAVLEMGGEVIGVIPKQLAEKEVAFTDLSDLRVVNTMHERKALMILIDDDPVELLKKFETYQPPKVDKAEWALSLTESF